VPGFKHETQVICTVLSHDLENDPDIVAMVAASAALCISGVPFMGPIGGARVGLIEGAYVLNPKKQRWNPDSKLDLVVAGTKDAVMMVESEAYELSEDDMLGAVTFGHEQMQPVIDMIIALAEQAAKEPVRLPARRTTPPSTPRARAAGEAGLRDAFATTDKVERQNEDRRGQGRDEGGADRGGGRRGSEPPSRRVQAARGRHRPRRHPRHGTRIDGRDLTTVRPIDCEVGVLPRTHGSALFTRGETQALVVTTLGTGDDEQIIDALEGESRSRFLLHYNFPPYSVGEAGRVGPPGRREIGHGKLAWRALQAVLPAPTDFPYTIRIVSEITESNGSSSMATVCGALAVDDGRGRAAQGAGGGRRHGPDPGGRRPLRGADRHPRRRGPSRRHGLQGRRHRERRHLAADGHQGRRHHARDHEAGAGPGEGRRMHILGEMGKALTEGRREFSAHAPRIETIQIPTDKIREVIGSGGKVIRSIVEESGAKVDINDDGLIKIASPDGEAIEKAKDLIMSIVAEPEVGKIYTGKVVKIMDFGAFVNFFGKRDGLVHVSQMRTNERGANPKDLVKEGQEVKVKLMGFDDRGKTNAVDEGRRPGDRRGAALSLRGRAGFAPAHSRHTAAMVHRYLGLFWLRAHGKRAHHGHVRPGRSGRDRPSLPADLSPRGAVGAASREPSCGATWVFLHLSTGAESGQV
jgi:polyribonucleotide nucleotidyltransferase